MEWWDADQWGSESSETEDVDVENEWPFTEWPLTEEQQFRTALFEHISEIHSTGSFATFGKVDNLVNPGIAVDHLGLMRLPLSQEDARALIQTCRQAPFGKGIETLVDVSVRKTWEIDGERVMFLNKGWQSCLLDIVEKAADELGIEAGSRSVSVKFYKMLLYEEGGMFKAHKECADFSWRQRVLAAWLEGKTFDTSGFSPFDATYLAWYADVTHEIQPVQKGFRWVLVYNLVHDMESHSCSASSLDARITDCTRLLSQWENHFKQIDFLIYPLEHQYTIPGLKSALLKGDDSYRARHIAQSCANHGNFYVLLANIEMRKRETGERQWTKPELRLKAVAEMGGCNLLAHDFLIVPEAALLKDAMILIPESSFVSFLAGAASNWKTPSGLNRLIDHANLLDATESDHFTSQGLIQFICRSTLSANHKTAEEKDPHLGPIAVIAVKTQDASLFSKTIQHTVSGFDGGSYSTLGALICLQEPIISEDDLVEALTKSGRLHKIYDAIESFREGFIQNNQDREDGYRQRHMQMWTDSVAIKALNEVQNLYDRDARTLVRMIIDRHEDNFRQFVLYQSVRSLVDRFLLDKSHLITFTIDGGSKTPGINSVTRRRGHKPQAVSISFITTLVVELCKEFYDSQPYLHSLLRRIVEPAAARFDLCHWANYVQWRFEQVAKEYNTKVREESASIRRLVGPIQAFYEQLDVNNRGLLLDRIRMQASQFPVERTRYFLTTLLRQLMKFTDTSSPAVQACFKSLVNAYIMRCVGKNTDETGDRSPLSEVFTWQDRYEEALAKLQNLPQDVLRKCLASEYDDTITLRVLETTEDSIDRPRANSP